MSLKHVPEEIAEIIEECGIGWLQNQSELATNNGQKIIELNRKLKQLEVSTIHAPIACLFDSTPGDTGCFRFVKFEMQNVQAAKAGRPVTVAVRMNQNPDTVPDRNGRVRRMYPTLDDFFEYNEDLRGKSDKECDRFVEEQVMAAERAKEKSLEERQQEESEAVIDSVFSEITKSQKRPHVPMGVEPDERPRKKRPVTL